LGSIRKPLKDVTAAGGVVFQADSRGQAQQVADIGQNGVVSGVRQVAEVDLIARICVLGGIDKALGCEIAAEIALIEIIAVNGLGEDLIIVNV